MKFINLFLLGTLALGLGACTVKLTDKSGEQEATQQFLTDFAEKNNAATASNIRTQISRNGSITFQSVVNDRCTISLSGRIDRAIFSSKTHYIVRYHYDRMSTPGWTCTANDDSSCRSELSSCQKASGEYSRRIVQSGSMVFKLGEDPKNVILWP